jgi:hypothetical protein
MNELLKQTFSRENNTVKAEYYEELYNVIIKLLEGFNYLEVEEFLEYTKDMMKMTSKPQVSIEAPKNSQYIPPYEKNKFKIKTIREELWC